MKRVFGLLLAAVLVLTLLPTVSAFGDGTAEDSAPGWQAEVTFPDWKGYTDDTALQQNGKFCAAPFLYPACLNPSPLQFDPACFYHKQEAETTLLGRLDFLFFSGCFAAAPRQLLLSAGWWDRWSASVLL